MDGDYTIIVKPSSSTRAMYRHFGILDEIPVRLSQLGTVDLIDPDPEAAGVTLWEVVSVYLTGKVAEPFLGQVVQNLANTFAAWITDRCKRGKGPRSNVSVNIYGPHGEVLSTVVLDKAGELYSGQ